MSPGFREGDPCMGSHIGLFPAENDVRRTAHVAFYRGLGLIACEDFQAYTMWRLN